MGRQTERVIIKFIFQKPILSQVFSSTLKQIQIKNIKDKSINKLFS